jgi:hypothetical protein
MTKSTKKQEVQDVMVTKRFVIRKSLVGRNAIITFTNKKGVTYTYDHDEVYNAHQERFESMECFAKYKNYTNSNAMPAFCRNLNIALEDK